MSAERFRIELFVFPDGASVEMMVFPQHRPCRTPPSAEAAPPATAPSPACASPPPREHPDAHRCPVCGSPLVYPVAWDRSGPSSWTIDLRCPECETRREVTLGRASVEQFNRELYQGAQALARAADRVTRRNFQDEVDRIVAALDRGLIQPMDF